MAAKFVMNLTDMDQGYQNGEFRFFTGDIGGPAKVNLPQSVSQNFIASTDSDPEVYSYMGISDGNPRALTCVVTTNYTTGTSTGKYFLYKGDPSTLTWTLVSSTGGVELQDSDGEPVAGNPYGVAQVGNFLYINEYDTGNIYTINITNFETAVVTNSATTYAVDDVTAVPLPTPPSGGQEPAAALIALTDNSGATPATYLYSLYNLVAPSSPSLPTGYDDGQVNRFTVNTSTGAITDDGSPVTVGKNAQALVPVPDGSGGFNILVPAIGGTQQAGSTNGTESNLYRINAFGTMAATLVLTGDGSVGTAISVTGNYDVKSVAVSASGSVWLLLVTSDANYKAWWKLYKTTMTDLLAYTAAKPLATAVSDGDLTLLDSGLGSPGYYWEVLFENSPSDPGRLWFVAGTPIRVSAGDDYDNKILFDEGVLYAPITGKTLYAVNLNSADLVGEMIYQYQQGNSIDTRLIKGKSASAEDEEEEK
jgi:hypothetical protein